MNPLTPINLVELAAKAPDPLQFVLPGMLKGTVGSLVSPGGTGKSMLALQIGFQMAGGSDRLKLGNLAPGKVAYFPAEDPLPVLRHRLYGLLRNLEKTELEKINGNFRVYSLSGERDVSLEGDAYGAIRTASEECQLVILDTLRRFHAKNENDSGDMVKVMDRLESLAEETGAAILFLHHTNKGMALSGQGDEAQAARGSSVLTDNARWQGYVAGMTKQEADGLGLPEEDRPGYLRFGIAKQNYGPPFRPVWLQRGDDGLLAAVGPEFPCASAKASKAAGRPAKATWRPNSSRSRPGRMKG